MFHLLTPTADVFSPFGLLVLSFYRLLAVLKYVHFYGSTEIMTALMGQTLVTSLLQHKINLYSNLKYLTLI